MKVIAILQGTLLFYFNLSLKQPLGHPNLHWHKHYISGNDS